MKTLAKGVMFLSLGFALTIPASMVASQMNQDLASPSAAVEAEQQQQGTPSQESTLPAEPSLASPHESTPPADSNPLPPQQTLVSSKTVVGVAVNNAQGEEMGTIREIMIDPQTGKVLYAVVDSVGSFGLGKQKSFAVPWSGLQVKLNQTEVVIQLEQNRFPAQSAVAMSR